MKKYQLCICALGLAAAGALGVAQTRTPQQAAVQMPVEAHSAHVMLTPAQVQWGPAPPSLPPGAQLAVLAGDPSKVGAPFTIRAKFPAGYKIPPHWHPEDENVVVIEGALMINLGEKFNPATGHELPAGSFALMPKEVRHYAWTKVPTVVQVYGIGPFAINYVSPADDPQRRSTP